MAFNSNSFIDEILIIKEDDSPQQQINEQSITQDLAKNRESLKRKLQARRSLKQLVDVGIISSLPFYEQRKQLQMRKTQDILKHKILSRPDRQLLIEHNILSDTTAAPAIQKTQCQLKRARLVDNLNDKLSVRPGILELVANNIFEIDCDLKQAIQDGYIEYPSTKSTTDKQEVQSFRPKTSSFSNTTTSKRSLNTISKSKSCLTFHEYKGPSQKVEITKVSLPPTVVSSEQNYILNENHYRIQLKQQQLFLELLHDNKSIDNLLQSPIDENNRILSPVSNEIQSYDTMKLADLKNICRKLNISSAGTKMKLIEKLKNARDTTSLPSQTINTESSSVKLLPKNEKVPVLLLSDQELYQQQQQKLAELEDQLHYFLSYQHQSSPSTIQHVDSPTTIPPKCNPILSVQIQKRILMQQQEKLKQKIQQHSIVPETITQFLVQSQTSNYLSTSSSSCQSTNIDTKFNNNDIIFNLLDDYTNSTSTFTLPPDDLYSNATPSTHMDWMEETSASIENDFYDDNNNPDFTQFLNQFGNDHHHLLFDSTCQQQNTILFDLFPSSSSMI